MLSSITTNLRHYCSKVHSRESASFLLSLHYRPHFRCASTLKLEQLGITPGSDTVVHRNLTYEEIAEEEKLNQECQVTKNGTFAINTGKYTGRSPKDKYIVDQAPSNKNIWWGEINQKMRAEVFEKLYGDVTRHFNDLTKFYVFDGYCGATPRSRKKVRFITELAWQHHFVTNMFIRPSDKSEIDTFEPDFTIINACHINNPDYKEQGLNSDVYVAFDIEKQLAIIGGTYYGGEMKKGIFSMMNYWLPLKDIMSMHCSANKGSNGDVALFFGLSGTGKTTLSADPSRHLIGDDEHGWDDDGVFNFEGGCYAKTINLSPENEPEIHRAIRIDALLENVCINDQTKEPDFFDTKLTENGRVSYPIYHIPNHDPKSCGGHPNNIIFLTCDAYGVLPPVSRLSKEQAMYHFLSGYTAKVAGTERGVSEPTATFSACFGAAFLPLHPTRYADLLQRKLEQHKTSVFLVNTGWTGGSYGTGKRMSIKDTRACIEAILDGSIHKQKFDQDPIFGFQVPQTLGQISPNILNPKKAWSNAMEYDNTARKLASMFQRNYKNYISKEHTDYSVYGPKI
uniref:phosphoenolpyruvate carboxykinase (ATP) n=1 Tax=Albugo laibachii Nc14 TaxID=890382 RepID=F0WT98_9STRA|nr:unnamed protein product [Albugo laibachii Nc14]|eukprot:CCA24587.1 unnamed protein product [Albugo laibachii Nc14]